MDLGAYAQIEELDQIAKANGIEVSRCRGYRLMKYEIPTSDADIQDIIKRHMMSAAEQEVRTVNGWVESSYRTDARCRKYLICKKKDWYFDVRGVNWKTVHGKLRKNIKLAMKTAKAETIKQYEMFNKYAGREDVLYIHARLGRTNWSDIRYYYYEKESWYLDGCNDSWDHSYCDIYAKIKTGE